MGHRKSSDSDIRRSFAALKRASQKARKLAEATAYAILPDEEWQDHRSHPRGASPGKSWVRAVAIHRVFI
jgi:hypothetical protein